MSESQLELQKYAEQEEDYEDMMMDEKPGQSSLGQLSGTQRRSS